MMRTPARSLLIASLADLLAALLLPAALRAQQPAPVGCYDLRLGPWTPELDVGVDSMYMTAPSRVRLHGDSADTYRPGTFVLETAPGALPGVLPPSWWEPLSPDSVELVWSSGYTLLTARLEVSGDTLGGEAQVRWDFSRRPQSADAIATGVPCGAPLRPEDRFRYRFPRGVRIAGRDSIRLGEPLPAEGVEPIGEKGDAWRVRGPLAPPLSGAEETVAVVDAAGVVRRIVVYFGSGSSHADVLEGMLPAYGEPTTRSVHERDDGSVMRHVVWYGRVMEVRLVEVGREGEPLRLQVRERGRR